MGKLKNKLIDEQDQKLIEAEKQEQPKPVRDWAEIAADDEARYQARRGNTGGVRWTGD